jgi:hypothetical protein
MAKVLVLVALTALLAAGLLVYGVLDWDVGGWIALVSLFAIMAVRFLIPFGWLGPEDVDDIDL